ncbi:MAG: hypothetical protein IJ545_02210 [Alphaproteobacteria bacterium]|nr:hypothetical protein [Alphaproteobacteria bacterium]
MTIEKKTSSSEINVEYLKMIEKVIERLANNAFTIQNWFIIVFGGLAAIFLKQENFHLTGYIFSLGVLIILTFYLTHAHYLWLECCYRQKYNRARKGEYEPFDMELGDIKQKTSRRFSSGPLWIYVGAFICLLLTAIINTDWLHQLWACFCSLGE